MTFVWILNNRCWVTSICTKHVAGGFVPLQLAEWWLTVAYLGWRLPVTVHVSPAIVFPPQPVHDTESFLR